jgi:hypothetical protein
MKKYLYPTADEVILKVVKHTDNIVYGARSIKVQTGIFGRNTFDYDIFSNTPKGYAQKTRKLLDTKFGDIYYIKMAKHKGTWKVMNIGKDKIINTKDDFSVADFTQMPIPIPKFIIIHGIKYRVLSAEAKAKINSLKDKEFKFRHKKDYDDLTRIKQIRKLHIWRLY